MRSQGHTVQTTLVALVAAAALGACGDTLIDHTNDNARRQIEPVTCTDPDQIICNNACKTQGVGPDNVCGSQCGICLGSSAPQNAAAACNPTADGLDRFCDFDCNPGYLKVAGACSAPALVAAGGQFSCATTATTGEVHCWGANDQGQLGTGATGLPRSTSGKVPSSALVGVTALAAGPGHACAVVGATIYCWGDAAGFGVVSGATPTPTVVPALADVVTLAAGVKHTCGVTAAGVVKCTGADVDGGGSPALGGTVLEIAAGDSFSCALVSGAPPTVKCWGNDAYGQLGTGTSGAPSATPLTVSVPGTVRHVAAGARHACAANDATSLPLYCWGDNSSNQLGTVAGTLLPPTNNDRVKKEVVRIAAGALGSCSVELDLAEVLDCWSADPIIAGGSFPAGEPNHIPFGNTTGPVSSGGAHTCFVESAVTPNQLRCFGHNDSGQLGDGTANVTPVAGTVQLVVDR